MRLSNLVFFLTLLSSPLVHAQYGSEYVSGFKPIDNAAFRSRLMVRGEIFVVSEDGKRLISPTTEMREWHAGTKSKIIDTHWATKAKGIRDIALHLVIEPKDDNSITVKIDQFENYEYNRADPKKTKYGKLIRTESLTVENFSPITWVVENSKDFRVVIRLTPVIDAVKEVTSLEKIPIGGDRGSFTVTDNQGYMWSDNVRFGGQFAGLTCHRGSFVISYYPFKGAKVIGFAQGKNIELNLTDDLTVKIHSDTDLIPGEVRAKVYGKYLSNLKSGSVNSATSFGQDKIENLSPEFLK